MTVASLAPDPSYEESTLICEEKANIFYRTLDIKFSIWALNVSLSSIKNPNIFRQLTLLIRLLLYYTRSRIDIYFLSYEWPLSFAFIKFDTIQRKSKSSFNLSLTFCTNLDKSLEVKISKVSSANIFTSFVLKIFFISLIQGGSKVFSGRKSIKFFNKIQFQWKNSTSLCDWKLVSHWYFNWIWTFHAKNWILSRNVKLFLPKKTFRPPCISKRAGPKDEPLGMPHLTVNLWEMVLLTTVHDYSNMQRTILA